MPGIAAADLEVQETFEAGVRLAAEPVQVEPWRALICAANLDPVLRLQRRRRFGRLLADVETRVALRVSVQRQGADTRRQGGFERTCDLHCRVLCLSG